MLHLITQVSKYLVLISMLVYTYLGFAIFRYEDKRKKSRILNAMFGLMVFMHFMNYLVLYLKTENYKLIILYGAELLLMLFMAIIYHWIYPNINELVQQHMMMLLSIGFVFVARLTFDTAVRQVAFASVAVVGSLIVPIIIEKFKAMKKLSLLMAVAGIGLLLVVLVFGVEKNGAKNWINLGGILLQPSEFVKMLFVFAMAGLLAEVKNFKHVVLVSILAAIHVLILVAETDLGGAFIFFLTYVVMLTVATQKMFYMFAGLAAGSVASVVAYRIFGHVRTRVLAWRDPWAYIDNKGYQVAQSLFAIGTGGWLGMGLGQGLPTSIPVVASDFIFSAISEEMGAIYAVCLILICMSCFIMFINISMRLKDLYYKLIALGLSVMYAIQVFLNIGGVTKLIPSTGVTLPLISAGGSSMLMTIIMFFVIQGLYLLNQKNHMKCRESEIR